MTNADYIRQMSDEELHKFLVFILECEENDCDNMIFCSPVCKSCRDCIAKWLKAEKKKPICAGIESVDPNLPFIFKTEGKTAQIESSYTTPACDTCKHGEPDIVQNGFVFCVKSGQWKYHSVATGCFEYEPRKAP